MIAPKLHIHEEERLRDLESYSILDTLPEEDFDNLTAIAAQICGTPISLISLVDSSRQWFKSHHGLGATETPREFAFCAHAIHDQDNLFMVEDARQDERFHDNPLVTGDPHVIFYAGFPLVTDEGFPLGTLCVIDHEPKVLNQSQKRSLSALSNQVMNLLKLRKRTAELQKVVDELEEKNDELAKFAYIAAHDLKSPLNNISMLANFLTDEHGKKMGPEGHEITKLIKSSSNTLRNLIDGLLDYSRSESILKAEKSKIQPKQLKRTILDLFTFKHSVEISLKTSLPQIWANRTVIEQILINLVNNAIKYNNKETTLIELSISESDSHYEFSVKDNGPGIAKEHQKYIFDLFQIAADQDRFGDKGNGIGLATVKKIVEKSDGQVSVNSDLGKGADFLFTLGK